MYICYGKLLSWPISVTLGYFEAGLVAFNTNNADGSQKYIIEKHYEAVVLACRLDTRDIISKALS